MVTLFLTVTEDEERERIIHYSIYDQRIIEGQLIFDPSPLGLLHRNATLDKSLNALFLR